MAALRGLLEKLCVGVVTECERRERFSFTAWSLPRAREGMLHTVKLTVKWSAHERFTKGIGIVGVERNAKVGELQHSFVLVFAGKDEIFRWNQKMDTGTCIQKVTPVNGNLQEKRGKPDRWAGCSPRRFFPPPIDSRFTSRCTILSL